MTLLAPYRFAAAGGPTLLAWDDYARADAAALGTSSSGHTWAYTGDPSGNPWTIASQVAHPPASGTGYHLAHVNAGQADVDIRTTFDPANGGANDAGLVARVVDVNNFVLFDWTWSAGAWLCRVFQRIGGSFSGLTALVNPVPELGADGNSPFRMRLVVDGNAGEAFYTSQSDLGTWISAGTFTGLDSSLLSSTVHGQTASQEPLAGFDDFAVYTAP